MSLKRPQNISKILSQSVVLCAVLGIITGCEAGRDEICRDFPAANLEIASVQAQIAILIPARQNKSGRQLASEKNRTSDVEIENLEEFTAEQRAEWLSWNEKALKRTQWVKDSLEVDRVGRRALPALNEAGISLVSLHGFLDQRKWKKAVAELDRVDVSLKRARKLACEAEVAAPVRKSRK